MPLRWIDTRRTLPSLLVLVVGALWPAATSSAAADSELLRAGLDSALQEGREITGAPAATATVMRCGRVVWSGGNGVTDVSSRHPVRPDTRFVVASASKPVTAALALDLVERGKLSLRTKLSRFYPKLPGARRITVMMLLDHTSGLNEYFDDPKVSKIILNQPSHRWRRSEALRGITKTRFKPGTRYSYSNSAYVVLGGVIEKVTRRGVERAFRARIGNPLRLSGSTFAYMPQLSDLFAHPYLRDKGALKDAFAPGIGVPSDYWGPVWTDGGLASTSPDLARFGDALFRGRILRPSTVRRMERRDRPGQRLGLQAKRYSGRTWLGHDGRYVGYETELWHDHARKLTVVVNSNAEKSSLLTWKSVVRAYNAGEPDKRGC